MPPPSGICKRVFESCGDNVARLYARLQDKYEFAHSVSAGKKQKYTLLIRYAREFFHGSLQSIDLGAPQPPPDIVRKMVLQSFIGLHTCINAIYYCKRGIEQNVVFLLVGPGGYGKTTFSAYLAMYLGGLLLTSEDDVLNVLQRMVEKSEWRPILILDDINAIISKYWVMMKSERAWVNLFKTIDYAKDYTSAILFTARSAEGPPKKFREIASYIGYVKRLPAGSALIDFIEWRVPRESRGVAVAYDVLWPGLKLPDDVWAKLKKLRKLRSELLIIENKLQMHEAGRLHLTEQEVEYLKERRAEILRELGLAAEEEGEE